MSRITIALLALLLGGCSHGLATAYRAYGVGVVSVRAADKSIGDVAAAKARRCESDHSADKAALVACLKSARKPVKTWVEKIKPAVASALSAFWLALESAYAAQAKKLSKMDKAVVVACAALQSAEQAVKSYKDKIGALAVPLLGAIGAGKVLVCP